MNSSRTSKDVTPNAKGIEYEYSHTRVVHGNTIELKTSSGIADGEEVEIEVRQKRTARPWGEGIMRSAGIAADVPGFDEDFSQIERDRKASTFREPSP